MKYIDADKLFEGIKHLQDNFPVITYEALLHLITSLQQERGPHTESWIEDTKKELQHEEELLEMRLDTLKRIREKKNQFKQEQPEVDLEKFTEKIKTFQGRYKYPEILSIKGAMAFMARMFYQYPNVARQWYDSLPKATMD